MSEIRFWKAVLSLLIVGAVFLLILHIWDVLVPFILGLVIAYLVHPLVDRFVAMGLRRDRVVLVLYIVLLSVTVYLGGKLWPVLEHEIRSTVRELPTYAASINGIVKSLNAEIRAFLTRHMGESAGTIAIPFEANKFVQEIFYELPGKLLGVVHFGLWIIIIPFVSYFGLSQGRYWIDGVFQLTPSEYVESLLGVIADVNATLGGYIRGQVLDAMCVGSITMLGLFLLGVDGAVLLGCVTGVLNVVPFMAPIVGGSLALLAGYFQNQSVSILLGIFLLYVGIRLFDDFVFIPFVLGHNVQLHPVIMLLAVLAGLELGGFLGLIFAIPAAAVIKVLLTVALRNRREAVWPAKEHILS